MDAAIGNGDHAALDHDFAAADATLKAELEGKINGKVAQGDFDTLKGRVDGHDTAIAGKVAQSDFDNHINAYNAKVSALEGKDTELAGKITALEAKDVELAAKDEELAGLIEGLGDDKQDKLTAGTNVEITEENVINVSIPTASKETIGGIKVGHGLKIDAETGVLDVVEGGIIESEELLNQKFDYIFYTSIPMLECYPSCKVEWHYRNKN